MSSTNMHGGPPILPPPLNSSKPLRTTSGAAIASLILGFLGLVFWVLTAVPAIILALVAKSDIRANPSAVRGSGLATTGLILGLAGLFVPFFWMIFFVSLFSGAPAPDTHEDGQRIAHIHLTGPLAEAPANNMPGFYLQSVESLQHLVARIEHAAEDDSVEALLFTLGAPALGMGQLEEIVAAVKAFKTSGKKVFAHGTALQTGTYTLLSGVSHLNVVPSDTVWLTGISLSQLHLKDALDKIGIKADVVQMGTYKAAGETLSRSGPSDAARENMNWLLDGLYRSLVDIIADSRGVTPDHVMQMIDQGPYTSAHALEAGLVDSVMFLDQFLEEIRNEYGDDVYIDNHYGNEGPSGSSSLIEQLLAQPAEITNRDPSIAIVYVVGMILQGYGDAAPFGGNIAFSGDLMKILDNAAADESVKAVVMRVDSPGGSAVASEEILRAAERLRAKKPLVVSMGSTAASGGYYVACKADAILADEMTITASIGVIGSKLVTTEMWNELGVNWTPYSRGENADIFNSDHPFTESERAWILSYMEETYDLFTGHVTEGRGDRLSKPIEEIASGRVYTGKQALELGLVDKIGGLADAIELAADKADIEDYTVRVMPEPVPFMEELMKNLYGAGERPSDLHFDARAPSPPSPSLRSLMPQANPPLGQAAAILEAIDPERTRAVMDALTAAEILRREGVAAIMPEMIVVR